MKEFFLIWFLTSFTGAIATGIYHSQKIQYHNTQIAHLTMWLMYPLWFVFFLLGFIFTGTFNNRATQYFEQYLKSIIYCDYESINPNNFKTQKEKLFEEKQSYSFFLEHKGELMIVNRKLARLIDVISDVDDVTSIEKYIFLTHDGNKFYIPTDTFLITLKNKLNDDDYNMLELTFKNE